MLANYHVRIDSAFLVNAFSMKRVNAKLVPKNLNPLQKWHRNEMLDNETANSTFIKRIITDDEMCVAEYDVKTV